MADRYVRIHTVQGVQAQRQFYEAAFRMLQFVEARRPTNRRFGADADARWRSFCGDLGASARIDLLLRDADAEWPGAFGARSVYGLTAVAEDEPFGAQWQPLDDVDAEELWRRLTAEAGPKNIAQAVAAIAAAWELSLTPHTIDPIGPTDRLVIAGPSAIAAVIQAFSQGRDLDWSDQVTVIATPPAHRHLAAAGAALVNATRSTRIVTADAPTAGARVVVSSDADPADRTVVETHSEG